MRGTPPPEQRVAMHQTLIKICGLSTGETVEAAVEAGAGMIGFIFFERSPRNLSIAGAAALSSLAGGSVARVAVTVDADDALLDRLVGEVGPDWLQLHGRETPGRLAELRARYGLPVMKAIAISDRADLEAASRFDGIADRLLFDAKPPQGSQLPGGNAVSFDWTLLEGFRSASPWMLSGGLDAGNVAAALAITGAAAVDVSSGVEVAPGVKSIEKIWSFVKTVREQDNRA